VSPSIADRLARAPAVRACRDGLGDARDAWVVGGAVRDAALGRDVTDVDLAVAGNEREAAGAIARAAGGPVFQLSEEFATWRVMAGEGSWHVDVARLRGDGIEADLALRDFTVNSIAVPLADPAAPALDPHGGIADLESHTLRAISDRSFADDPLRIMRAARIAAALAFEIDDRTAELARAEASRAAEPAGERQFTELRLLITGPDPIRGIELLDLLGATAAVLPELDELHGVVQNPNHHLDVYDHTIELLRRLLEVEAELHRLGGQRSADGAGALSKPVGDDLSRAGALRLGALVHDVGKPATRQQRGDYVTFIGHDREGTLIVASICERLKVSRRLTRHLQGLTLHHLRLGFLVHERPLSRRRIYEYLRDTGDVAADVTLLSVADRLAARGEGPIAGPEMVEAHVELARDMLAAAVDWHREGPPRSPIRGDELAAELDLDPGPELGRLLAEIEAAVYAGDVTSREDAIAFARDLVSG